MKPVRHRDIGIFFGRPDRTCILAEKLRGLGFCVTLYNRQGIPGTYVPVPRTFPQALSRLLSTKHEIYLTELNFTPSLCLYLNRRLRGIPYIYTAVGLHSATYQRRSRRWPFPWLAERFFYPTLMDRVLAGASWIVCNSQYLQARFRSQFPAYAHKMVTIYNGIEFETFASGRPLSIDGVSSDAPKLLAVMTWNYDGKAAGGRLLMDAMGYVVEKHPDARLIIGAKTSHGRYARENEAYLAGRPWKDSIKILYNQQNIPDLLATTDLFVYASLTDSNDSLPRALLEAHAAGLPIVTTATTGCPEVVEDSVTGFLVPHDAQALAERVIDLLADPGKRQEMGRRGRERVHRIFSWDRMAEAYARLFCEIAPEQTRALRAKTVAGG